MDFFKKLSSLDTFKPMRLILGFITAISILVTVSSIIISAFDRVYEKMTELEKEQYKLKFNQLILEQETIKRKEFNDFKTEIDELSNLVMNNFKDIIEIRKNIHDSRKEK